MSLTNEQIDQERAMWVNTRDRSRARREPSDVLLAERHIALCDLALQALAGEEYVIRKDADDNLGVIYTDPKMIGQVVRLSDTGKRAKLP